MVGNLDTLAGEAAPALAVTLTLAAGVRVPRRRLAVLGVEVDALAAARILQLSPSERAEVAHLLTTLKVRGL